MMDAPPFASNEELQRLTADEHGWPSRVRDLDPDLSNNNKGCRARSRQVTATLNASAEVWKATTDVHDGRFMM